MTLALATIGGGQLRKLGIFLCLTIMFLFAGLNPGKGTDYQNYEMLFYSTEDLLDARDLAFYVFVMAVRNAGFEFQGFLLLIALLYFASIKMLTDRLSHPILFVFIYLSGFYLYFQFNAIKQGLAIFFMLVALSSFRQQGRVFFLTAAAFTHTSQAALVLLDLARHSKILVIFMVIPVFWLIITFYSQYALYPIIETKGTIYPVLIAKGLFCLWALRFGVSKFWVLSVVASVFAVQLGAIYISRIVDALVLIIVFQICCVSRSFTIREKVVIAVAALAMFVGSLNIIYQDCAIGSIEWCGY
jgi:hypothetical protein